MPSPFPGMDPYLERYWGDVHHNLCTYIRDAIQPQIRPALMARIEERLVIETDRPAPRSMYPDMKIEVFRGGRPIRGSGGGTAVAGVAEPLMLHYLDACVHRGWGPMVYEFYQLPIRERLPKIRIPLREGDADAVVDLQAVVDQVYLNGAYESIRYDVPPEPPLEPDDAVWADRLLVTAGLLTAAGRPRAVSARHKSKPRKKP